MNRIKAKIVDLTTSDQLTIVKLEADSQLLSTIVIDTPETSDLLSVDSEVFAIFKETEVFIAKGTVEEGVLSLQNRFVGKLTRLERGTLLSRLSVETPVGSIISVITTNAVDQLNLSEGETVTALVKTNEIMLSK